MLWFSSNLTETLTQGTLKTSLVTSLISTSDLLHHSWAQSCRMVCGRTRGLHPAECGDVAAGPIRSCSRSSNLSGRIVFAGNRNSSKFIVAFLQAATVLTVKHWTVDLTSFITLLVNYSEHLRCLYKATSLQTPQNVFVCV